MCCQRRYGDVDDGEDEDEDDEVDIDDEATITLRKDNGEDCNEIISTLVLKMKI